MEKRGLALVPPVADQDTIETLADLLKQAQEGKIVGLVYVAMSPGSKYAGDVVGSARTSTILARGLVGALWDQLRTFRN